MRTLVMFIADYKHVERPAYKIKYLFTIEFMKVL
jgi:hypothetical protein